MRTDINKIDDITPEMKLNDILSCLNAGGYACGAGEWRPERDGSFGRFHIETIK